MIISVVIPAYNASATLPHLLDSLSKQTGKDFEIIIVDDGSTDGTAGIVPASPHVMIRLPENHGPAYCRNRGAATANGDILAFTDSDCRVTPIWIENIRRHFMENQTEAIMGKLTLMPSSFIGDAISALGFPAGGAIGFDKIWKVDKNGYTSSLSSCNCAIRKNIFFNAGGFDEGFPYAGGEDSFLAYRLVRSNYRIKYCPDVLAFHEARDSLKTFIQWQFRRGMSSFIFARKVSNKKDYLSLRMWSTGNIVKHSFSDRKFPLILLLLMISYLTQSLGFLYTKVRTKDVS